MFVLRVKAELIDRGRKMDVILEAWLSASEPYELENALWGDW